MYTVRSALILLFGIVFTKDQWELCGRNDCLNGGTCRYDTRIPKKELCFCKFGHTGSRCQIKNPCYRNEDPDEAGYRDPLLPVCLNGGNCVPKGNDDIGYHADCMCAAGYKGRLCESLNVVECEEGICNDGQCELHNNRTKIVCNCFPGKHGDRCQFDDKCYHLNPCANDGTCTMVANDYKCSCQTGWTGKNCTDDVNECESRGELCSNNGKCVNTKGSFYCECSKGWTKDRQCRVWTSPCSENPCVNDGTCRYNEHTYEESCDCAAGFSGSFCQIRAAGCTECLNGGKCGFGKNVFSCSCPSNFTGPNCERLRNPCEETNALCNNGGVCSPELSRPAGRIKCICQPPYHGDLCDIPIDFCLLGRSRCRNGAQCMSTPTSFKCICPPGLRGELCEKRDPCAGFPCLNHGTCVGFDDDHFRCKCPFGFHGQRCEKGMCPCENGGVCTLREGCECQGGYTGKHCQIQLDSNNPIIALNLSIGDKRYRDDLVTIFKTILSTKLRGHLGDINVTNCSDSRESSDCVRILVRTASNRGALRETLDEIKSLDNLPAGMRVTGVQALVQSGDAFLQQLRPKETSTLARLLIGIGIGVIAAVIVIALVAVLRTQAILKGLRWPVVLYDENGTGGDSRKRKPYEMIDDITVKKAKAFDGSELKISRFSGLKNKFLRIWTPAQVEDDQYRMLLESDRALIYSILTCNQSTDNDKAYRLNQALDIFRHMKSITENMIMKILSCINDKTQESALHVSVRRSFLECTRVLLGRYPTIVHYRDGGEKTVLHLAAGADMKSMLEVIWDLSHRYWNINAVDLEGRTALQTAILSESTEVVKFLLSKGAKINLITCSPKVQSPGSSALHLAAQMDNTAAISLLLSQGAQIDLTNEIRETPLMYAIRNNSFHAAKLLISYGARVDIVSKHNWSPLSLASNSTQAMLAVVRQGLFEQQLERKNESQKSKKRSKTQSKQSYQGEKRRFTLEQNPRYFDQLQPIPYAFPSSNQSSDFAAANGWVQSLNGMSLFNGQIMEAPRIYMQHNEVDHFQQQQQQPACYYQPQLPQMYQPFYLGQPTDDQQRTYL